MTTDSIKSIKHQFMAFRNGIVSDTLRRAGMPYKIIFGLQLPQLSQIARSFTPSLPLADKLWEEKAVRESRLLACYLFPKEEIDEDKALQLVSSLQTPEEADILCFRLLRYLPFSDSLPEKIEALSPLKETPERESGISIVESGTSDEEVNPNILYCARALRRNIEAMK